jgi:hypothetical protein
MKSLMSLVVVVAAGATIPTIEEMSGRWIDPNAPVSKMAPSAPELGANQRDLPTVNNFWGSVGIAPESVRPVDLFGVNSLELPPFAGCGANHDTVQFGCGRLLVDSEHVQAAGTKWSAHEAGRRSAQLKSGLVIETATRMPYEQNGVVWKVDLTNNASTPIKPNVTFELAAMVQQFATVGSWVYSAPNDPSTFHFTAHSATSGAKGVLSQSTITPNKATKPAASLFFFAGSVQPDTISHTSPPTPPTPPPTPLPPSKECYISGLWTQMASGATFGPFVQTGTHFEWLGGNATLKKYGWDKINGTIHSVEHIDMWYHRPLSAPGSHGLVHEQGSFIDCDHLRFSDSPWNRPGHGPSPSPRVPPVPSASFTSLVIAPGATVTIRVGLSVGSTTEQAVAAADAFAKDVAIFDASWHAARDKWQVRWANVFKPGNGDFSGNLPTLDLRSASKVEDAAAPMAGQPAATIAANVERVYYMAILTFLSVMRSNLPIIHSKVFTTSQGNLGGLGFGGGAKGIGGSRGWWWDQSLVSMMIAMLEPTGRTPELNAWLSHDLMGKGGKWQWLRLRLHAAWIHWLLVRGGRWQ